MAICYINSHNQLCRPDGSTLLRPTILFENDMDVFHKVGEAECVEDYQNQVIHRYTDMGLTIPDFVTMELTKIPVEDACYIIRRASEYTLSGFLPKLYQLVTTKPEEEVIAWLTNEKTRIPIDVYANI